MNKLEVIKLISLLSTNYRNWPAEGKEEDTVMLWETMLSDLSFEVGQAAVKVHMSRSVYPPTIADIREAAALVRSPKRLEAIESWGMVVDAIRKFGYYREAEAMATLPTDVVNMVKRFTWRELCLSENVDTLRAQWRMAWENHLKNKQNEKILPSDVLDLIESGGAIKRLTDGT